MELGQRIPTPEETSALLVALEIGGEEAAHVLALSRRATESRWWEVGAPGLPRQLKSWIGFEQDASAITDWSLDVVPGLLQTAAYAHAIIRLACSDPDELESRVAARLARQAILTRDTSIEYTAILDESVLRRSVGGRAVMAEQLRQLQRLGDRENITIHVTPLESREHLGLSGSYAVAHFDTGEPLVQIEHQRSAVILDDEDDVRQHVSSISTLVEMAMTSADSAAIIEHTAVEMEG
ncbi:hypothetical protein UA74_03480 [Actinoalloteichus fjordicus]|uniref:DUF5753 domain-containing protein n=2 Tax=Actinoalloteichus fjordicus TaxID=1612552 RepID=A0AAC9L7Z6_9PSEU|nr:hypothetical protein UA74_03480 [Actinoalloteichus fjordicus]